MSVADLIRLLGKEERGNIVWYKNSIFNYLHPLKPVQREKYVFNKNV